MMKRTKKNILILCTIWLSFMLVTGCTVSQKNETKHVTILYSSKSNFEQDFGNINQHFPNIKIDVIEYQSILGNGVWNDFEFVPQSGDNWDAEMLISEIRDVNPDIMFFPLQLYPRLQEEGLLFDLSILSKERELQNIDTQILDTFREMGNGNLYAVSNTIATQALYYNRGIFKKYGITEPVDFMNWEDVLKLGNTISELGKSDEIVGLQTQNYGNVEMFLQAGKSNGLNWYDPVHNRVLFSSDAWKATLELVVEKYKSEWNSKTQQELGSFSNGHVAMALDTYRLKDELKQSNSDLDWDLVTAPVTSHDTNKSTAITFQYLNGINRETKDISSTKEVWLYLNSSTVARTNFNANYFRFTLPVIKGLVKDDGKNVEAFYKVMPKISNDTEFPLNAKNELSSYLDKDIQKIVSGALSIDEAVKNWEIELLVIMQRYQ
ncbi:ABC transporter substrate-binding protein [Paenibacillus rubinfantis]|uniref:ABC transporter substrate-binding protein n=1 Tax=Paenibacillus rubinfantis TaxID=1720296 RepID=UPI00073F0937|nr:ABC transporter substrate-binding protein [Paenibacillus rubinfantis]